MASPPNSPGELIWYQMTDRSVLIHFLINLPGHVSDHLKWNYFIDREAFKRLVCLGRDPILVMKAISLWIWVEEVGYPTIILEMVRQEEQVVNSLLDEAEKCINCIENAYHPPPVNPNGDLPLTRGFMNRDISLQFFFHNRLTALHGITKIMNDVCGKIFGDIVQLGLENVRRRNRRVPQVNPERNEEESEDDDADDDNDDDDDADDGDGDDEMSSTGSSPAVDELHYVPDASASVPTDFDPWRMRDHQPEVSESGSEPEDEELLSDESD